MVARKKPPHGTVQRYRLELKDGEACDKCRSANARARREYRSRRRAKANRPHLSIVRDTPDEHTPEQAPPAAGKHPAGGVPNDPEPDRGPMEDAVIADIAESAGTSVAFHRSLSAMAKALAREVDSAESKASKASSIKQLYEVLKALRGEEESANDHGVDALLAVLAEPLPGMPSADLHQAEPQ